MKKVTALLWSLITTLLILSPFAAFATPTSWDYAAGTLQPLQSQWGALLKFDHLQSTSTSATSTFAYTVQAPCFSLNGTTCITPGSGTVTQINTTFPVLGGPITTTGTLTFGGLSTSTAAVVGNIPYFSGVNTFANVATSTLTATSPLTGSFTQIGSGGSLGCQTASGSQAGCLSAADWTTFNGKQAAGNYITALTGDVTASGPGSAAATLATVNSNVGSFTNANITVNAKGLITAASSGSSGGSVAGSNGQVQYNKFGVFGADPFFTIATSSGIATLQVGQPSGSFDLGKLALSYQGSVTDNTVTLSPVNGTSGAKTINVPALNGTMAISASGNIAEDSSGNLTFTGTLPIANGGTNNTSFTSNRLTYFDGTKLNDASALYYSGGFLGIGTTTGAFPTVEWITGNSGAIPLVISGTTGTDYSNIVFTDKDSNKTMSIGYGNLSVAITALRSKNFIQSLNTDLLFMNGASGANEYARLTSGGLFGVGTTTPWAQLSASSTSAYPTFAANQNSTGPVAIFTGGNVGISTTSPSQALSVTGNAIISGIATSIVSSVNGLLQALSLSGGFSLTSNTLSQIEHRSFTYATSTAWTGTTTIPLEVGYGEVWNTVQCFTDAGTLNVDFYHSTNHLNLFNASTTVGTITFTTNNTITAGDKTFVDIGTPATSPTRITCTPKDVY